METKGLQTAEAIPCSEEKKQGGGGELVTTQGMEPLRAVQVPDSRPVRQPPGEVAEDLGTICLGLIEDFVEHVGVQAGRAHRHSIRSKRDKMASRVYRAQANKSTSTWPCQRAQRGYLINGQQKNLCQSHT
jgi:hypothetical protein